MIDFIKNLWNKLFPKKVAPEVIELPIIKESKYQRIFSVAQKEIGVKEVDGNGENPRIAEYAKATSYGRDLAENYHDSDIPWCAMFINWCLKQIGEKGTDSAGATSFLGWGITLTGPTQGCILVLQHQNGGHHVTLYSHTEGDFFFGLGGNQQNKVGVNGWHKSEVMKDGFRGFKS